MLKVIVISCFVIISGYNIFEADAAPIQNLPHKDGYIPVYIRIGDTPLSEIHPGLAEAFKESEISHQIVEETQESNEVKRQAT